MPPISGPIQKTHWSSHFPDTPAGPKARAGLRPTRSHRVCGEEMQHVRRVSGLIDASKSRVASSHNAGNAFAHPTWQRSLHLCSVLECVLVAAGASTRGGQASP